MPAGQHRIGPEIRQKRASTPTPGGGVTILRSMLLTVSSTADMIPVSAPDTLALRPNGCSDIQKRHSQASAMLWRWPNASLTRSREVSLSRFPRWFTSIEATRASLEPN